MESFSVLGILLLFLVVIVNLILGFIYDRSICKRLSWLEGRVKGGRDPKRFDKK